MKKKMPPNKKAHQSRVVLMGSTQPDSHVPGEFVMVKRELPLLDGGRTKVAGDIACFNGPHLGQIMQVIKGGFIVSIRAHQLIIKDREIMRGGI